LIDLQHYVVHLSFLKTLGTLVFLEDNEIGMTIEGKDVLYDLRFNTTRPTSNVDRAVQLDRHPDYVSELEWICASPTRSRALDRIGGIETYYTLMNPRSGWDLPIHKEILNSLKQDYQDWLKDLKFPVVNDDQMSFLINLLNPRVSVDEWMKGLKGREYGRDLRVRQNYLNGGFLIEKSGKIVGQDLTYEELLLTIQPTE